MQILFEVTGLIIFSKMLMLSLVSQPQPPQATSPVGHWPTSRTLKNPFSKRINKNLNVDLLIDSEP